MKIGQIALIAFILLVAVVVCFLLLMCCMYCPTLFGGGYRGQPQPETGGYYPTNIQGIYYSENDNLEKIVNPIPTGHGRNQPIYERHVTKSGRNRVKWLNSTTAPCVLTRKIRAQTSMHAHDWNSDQLFRRCLGEFQ